MYYTHKHPHTHICTQTHVDRWRKSHSQHHASVGAVVETSTSWTGSSVSICCFSGTSPRVASCYSNRKVLTNKRSTRYGQTRCVLYATCMGMCACICLIVLRSICFLAGKATMGQQKDVASLPCSFCKAALFLKRTVTFSLPCERTPCSSRLRLVCEYGLTHAGQIKKVSVWKRNVVKSRVWWNPAWPLGNLGHLDFLHFALSGSLVEHVCCFVFLTGEWISF